MNPASATHDNSRPELGSLANELVRAYEERLAAALDLLGLAPEEADRHARGLAITPELPAQTVTTIRARDPGRVSWGDLQVVTNLDPEAAMACWETIKAEARDELATGHRAAQALEWGAKPMQRARFLAIRDSLLADIPSPSGLEAILVDTVAEAYSTWLDLTEQATMLRATEAELERDDLKRDGRWQPPHEVMAKEVARVEQRAEQAHKRLFRSVKALTELRRSAQTVYVANAGQVNVGQQQVNLSPKETGEHLAKSSARNGDVTEEARWEDTVRRVGV